MTTYTTISDATLTAGKPITQSVMRSLRDNPLAIQEGDATAPAILDAALDSYPWAEGDLAASAVDQSTLKTATAAQSTGSITAGTNASVALTGGSYTMVYTGRRTSGTGTAQFDVYNSNTAWYVQVTEWGGVNSIAVTIDSRYVQASPPWNLGNGDIALFVMAMVHKSTKEVDQVYVAEDPPWFAHGPHDLGPRGRFQRALQIWGEDVGAIIRGQHPELDAAELKRRINQFRALGKRQRNQSLRQEWTQQEKNVDMAAVPHLFDMDKYTTPSDWQPVIIDPVGAITDRLALLEQLEAGGIVDLLSAGTLVMGDELTGVITPPGVIAVSATL